MSTKNKLISSVGNSQCISFLLKEKARTVRNVHNKNTKWSNLTRFQDHLTLLDWSDIINGKAKIIFIKAPIKATMLSMLGRNPERKVGNYTHYLTTSLLFPRAPQSAEYLMNSSSTRERLQRERISSWRSWTRACSTFSLSQSHCSRPSPPALPFLPPCARQTKPYQFNQLGLWETGLK